MGLNRTMRIALLACWAVLLAGCLQIDTTIQLHPDGTLTVTERVRFSRELLNLSMSATRPDLKIASLLEKPAAMERMKEMGPGVELVSHEVRDAVGAARESLVVFRVANADGFEYASPFLGVGGYQYHNKIRMSFSPSYANDWHGWWAGALLVNFGVVRGKMPLPPPKAAPPPPPPGTPPPPGPTPAELQMLRELQPVLKDMMRDFRVRVYFDCYTGVSCGSGVRGSAAGATGLELIDVSDQNMDHRSMPWLDNEEVMLEVARGQLTGRNIEAATRDFASNSTLSVYRPGGAGPIYFRPSKFFYDKYFAGKTLDFGERGGKKPADFGQIGWRGKQPPKSTSRPDASATSGPN